MLKVSQFIGFDTDVNLGGIFFSIIQTNTDSGVGGTITYNSNAKSGDIVLYANYVRTQGSGSGKSATAPAATPDTTPSNYTKLATANGSIGTSGTSAHKWRGSLYYRKLSADGSGTITGFDLNVPTESHILAVCRPNTPITTITAGTFTANAATGANPNNPASQTISALDNGTPGLIAIAVAGGDSVPNPFNTDTPGFETYIHENSTDNQTMGFTFYPNYPKNHTVDVGNDLAGVLISGWLEVK